MSEHLKRMKELRLQKGISQKDIASALGITVAAYSLYERGNREPNIEMLKKIADYFDVSLDFLMRGTDAEQKEYYLNEETAKTAQEIFENKELRMLFDAARDADAEDLKALHSMALALKRKERGYIDDTGC